jgi:hypothetical protein
MSGATMTTSFDAMHDETRPLALLDEPQLQPRRSPAMILASALALLLPVLIVILL